MFRKLLTGGIILIFLLTSIIPFASSNNIYVNDYDKTNYNSIQDAIDKADDGDTIHIGAGTYCRGKTIDYERR